MLSSGGCARKPVRFAQALVPVLIALVVALPVQAASQAITFHTSTVYNGIESYASLDTTGITSGWQAAPIGVTNWAIEGFMEAGPARDCSAASNNDCKLHPYSTYETTDGLLYKRVLTDVNLGEYGQYIYRVILGSDNLWRSTWCSSTQCRTIYARDLGRYNFERVAVGIESSTGTALPIKVRSIHNRYRTGSWAYYCYESYSENVTSAYATICNVNDHSWYVNRGY